MASILLNKETNSVKVVDSFDCLCGGRAVVKSLPFKNRWGRVNEEGKPLANVCRYYAQCLTCGEVTTWSFSPEEAMENLILGRVIKGYFDKCGKFKFKK